VLCGEKLARENVTAKHAKDAKGKLRPQKNGPISGATIKRGKMEGWFRNGDAVSRSASRNGNKRDVEYRE